MARGTLTQCLRDICVSLCNQVSHLSPVSHPSNPPVKVYRETWDTWDTKQYVSVALGNGTLRGLTSLAAIPAECLSVNGLLAV